MALYDINGNVVPGSSSSSDFGVTEYDLFVDSDGVSARQAVLTYQGKRLYPKNYPEQQIYKVKVYDGGLMIALGDSYTAMASTFFDSFASKHGLIQKNVGLVSSKIARPEGEGQDTIKSFVTRLDELISSFPLTVGDKQYTLSDVKLITFMGGANDWTTVDASKNVDRIGNKYSTDVGQLYGACKYIFAKLLSTFPASDIVVILQPNNLKSDGIDQAEMWTKETAVKECAEMYSLPICDCCFNFYSPMDPNELSKYWQSDKLHLTHDGNTELFKKLESTLNTLSSYKAD